MSASKKKKKRQGQTPDTYRRIFDVFKAPVCEFDCGEKCAPLSGGESLCCSTGVAIPVANKAEFKFLRSRSDLWHEFVPADAAGRKVADELADECMAMECKGVRHCERDNRSLACRAFPFFPYITREGTMLGLSYYWDFEDRCWLISNLERVTVTFVRQAMAAFLMLMADDQGEFDVYKDHSAVMRRVFSRWRQDIPVLTPDGNALSVKPRGAAVRRLTTFYTHGPYQSAEAFARAVREQSG
ncbi:MAG TPA: hypothetical protein ENI55_02545 [Alphaproteobacteria bacterium]|nr:hypothetical protein [Alphaproteobacteria bacterium]